jgi:hypothetical protein
MTTTQPTDDSQLIALLDVEYFNLEFSEDLNTLVFNASKKGIDTFLNTYGHLEVPPETISFEKSARPERRWHSQKLEENPNILPSDLTPFQVSFSGKNMLVDMLHICFNEDDTESVLWADIRDEVPVAVMTVNKKGWQQFLTLIHCLRDKSYWFYVSALMPAWHHLPFQLTAPYRGKPADRALMAIEFIRLEPSNEIFLKADLNDVRGNATGLLLFSYWMRSFATSEEMEKDIYSRWNEPPKGASDSKDPRIWIHLRKTRLDSPYPLFSFEEESNSTDPHSFPKGDFYIFGNQKGFEEIAQIVEEYAFLKDDERFFPCNREKNEAQGWEGCHGDPVEGGLGPKGFCSWPWWIVGGPYYTPKYNPYKFKENADIDPRSRSEIRDNFINDRILSGRFN